MEKKQTSTQIETEEYLRTIHESSNALLETQYWRHGINNTRYWKYDTKNMVSKKWQPKYGIHHFRKHNGSYVFVYNIWYWKYDSDNMVSINWHPKYGIYQEYYIQEFHFFLSA